jgi:DNA-directed RNA polymerase subunit beta'
MVADEYPKAGGKVVVKAGDEVAVGTLLIQAEQPVHAQHPGVIDIDKTSVLVRREERVQADYVVPAGARLRVADGDQVEAGQQLTDGAKNPHRILAILGVAPRQEYLLDEIQKVYRSQGVAIHDKHIEIIIRQMLSKVRVLRPGDTKLLPGDLVDKGAIEEINARVAEEDGRPATFQQILLGITKAALETESILSAASFQHTINVLAKAAIEGKTDQLIGLKENVILGKLIPAGTGFRRREMMGFDDADIGGMAEFDLSDEALADLLEDDISLEAALALVADDEELDVLVNGTADETDDVDALGRAEEDEDEAPITDLDDDDLDDADADDDEEDEDTDLDLDGDDEESDEL